MKTVNLKGVPEHRVIGIKCCQDGLLEEFVERLLGDIWEDFYENGGGDWLLNLEEDLGLNDEGSDRSIWDLFHALGYGVD